MHPAPHDRHSGWRNLWDKGLARLKIQLPAIGRRIFDFLRLVKISGYFFLREMAMLTSPSAPMATTAPVLRSVSR